MEPMNYYPNSPACTARTQQIVRLTFGQGDYQKVLDVRVCSTGKGFYAIESALEYALERLYGSNSVASITLVNPAGEVLVCQDDEGREDDWLMDMLLKAEILSSVPEESPPGKRDTPGARLSSPLA